jgi:hypothetical protein
MFLSWLRPRVKKFRGERRPSRRLRRGARTASPTLEVLEDRCVLSTFSTGMGVTGAVLDAYTQIQALTNPNITGVNAANAGGYLIGDLSNLSSLVVGAIPGVDAKTTSEALATAGDAAKLISDLFFQPTADPGAETLSNAYQDLQKVINDVNSGNATQAGTDLNTAGGQVSYYLSHFPPPDGNGGTGLISGNAPQNAAVGNMVSAYNSLATAVFLMGGNPAGASAAAASAQADLNASDSGPNSYVQTQKSLADKSDALGSQLISDASALAGDVANLSGAPPIVGDALKTFADAIPVVRDVAAGNDPKASDLATLASDGDNLLNDVFPPPQPGSQPLSVTVGSGYTPGAVATFTDPNIASGQQAPLASAYTAYVNWGNGSSSIGQVATADNYGTASYTVTATPPYAASGQYPVSVIVSGNGTQGQGEASVWFNAGQGSQPSQGVSVTAPTLAAQAGQTVSGSVATFTAPASGNYSATIAWGDGTTSTGQVIATGNGSFAVAGSHTYTQAGDYVSLVLVADGSGNFLGSAFGTGTPGSPGPLPGPLPGPSPTPLPGPAPAGPGPSSPAPGPSGATTVNSGQVGYDALLVVFGLETGDYALLSYGLSGYQQMLKGLPGSAQAQAQNLFTQDLDTYFMYLGGTA